MRIVEATDCDGNHLSCVIENRATAVASVEGKGRLPQAARAMQVTEHTLGGGHGLGLAYHFCGKAEGIKPRVLSGRRPKLQPQAFGSWPVLRKLEKGDIVILDTADELEGVFGFA